MHDVAPPNWCLSRLRFLWSVSAGLFLFGVLWATRQEAEPGPATPLWFAPFLVLSVCLLLYPFFVDRPRRVKVGGRPGEEYVLCYFGGAVLGYKGPVLAYATEGGIWVGVWDKEFFAYGDIRRAREGWDPFARTLMLEMASGRVCHLGFGRSALAESFVRTLAGQGVPVDQQAAHMHRTARRVR